MFRGQKCDEILIASGGLRFGEDLEVDFGMGCMTSVQCNVNFGMGCMTSVQCNVNFGMGCMTSVQCNVNFGIGLHDKRAVQREFWDGLHDKRAVQREFWLPTQHLFQDRGKPQKNLVDLSGRRTFPV